MENDVRAAINGLLIDTYHALLDIEQLALDGTRLDNLTVSDVHVLESIGDGECMMSELARRGRVSTATMTSNIDRLVSKGYCARRRAENDRRRVMVWLTREGQQAVRLHRMFHRKMVDAAVSGLSPDDERVLAGALTKLRAYVEASVLPDAIDAAGEQA